MRFASDRKIKRRSGVMPSMRSFSVRLSNLFRALLQVALSTIERENREEATQ